MAIVRARYRDLLATLEKVEAALSTRRQAWGFGFVQAIIIIVREGIEAALLLGVMLTYLTATGFRALRRYVVFGSLAGLLLGGITWGAARTLITISPLQRETLEGLTSLLAAAVLLSISLWMIHHADLQRWKNYIRRRAESALSAGSILALAFAAFLAVYREAFETVLFFEVLWFKAPAAHTGILLGFVVGTLALTILMTAIFRFGLRIPLKPFFSATGALLGVLVFVFVGYGIRELQSIGWIKETALPWDLRLPLLDIYPTVEGMALQTAVVLTFVLGWLAAKFERGRQLRPAMETV
jgi:high-affinity iron transporter